MICSSGRTLTVFIQDFIIYKCPWNLVSCSKNPIRCLYTRFEFAFICLLFNFRRLLSDSKSRKQSHCLRNSQFKPDWGPQCRAHPSSKHMNRYIKWHASKAACIQKTKGNSLGRHSEVQTALWV